MSSVEGSPPPAEQANSAKTDKYDSPSKQHDPSSPLSKKGQPWTEEEHLAFLSGLKKLGKGNWRGISKYFVPTRTPTQVASHAQKHFMRIQGVTKRKSRFSALEQEVLGIPPPSNSSKPSSAASASAAPMAMTFPCMFPPMMFAMPGAAGMLPFMYPPQALAAAAAAMGTTMPKGSGGPSMMGMLPMFNAFNPVACMPAMFAQAAALAGSSQAHMPVVCKPEATHASSAEGATELLNKLQTAPPADAQPVTVGIQHSSFSAFRPAHSPQIKAE